MIENEINYSESGRLGASQEDFERWMNFKGIIVSCRSAPLQARVFEALRRMFWDDYVHDLIFTQEINMQWRENNALL